MRAKRRAFIWLLFLTLGWLLAKPHAHASLSSIPAGAEAPSRYQSPEDLLDLIPFLGDLPKTFLIGDGFEMKLSGHSLRIDHMGTRSKSGAKKRDCMVGLSYVTPVAGFFTSRVDVPLLFSPSPELEQWSINSLGDYVAYFSKGVSDSSSVRLALSARF